MRQIKAKQIFNIIKNACINEGLTFTKRGYRKAKLAYLSLPRTKRILE